MKKFLSVLLILIATCLTLTGCTTSVKNDAKPNETEETPTVETETTETDETEVTDETLEVVETEETVDIADCFSEDYYIKGTMVIPGSHTLETEFTFKDGEFYDELHGDSYVRFVRETEDSIVLYVNFGQIEAEEATFDKTTLPSLSNTDVETKHWGPGTYSVGHDEIYLEFIKK